MTQARQREPAGWPGASNRGTNQSGVRVYNERLVLSLIRRQGALPKADIARQTGLSPQTISIIINQLTDDGLLLRGNPQRGRIGQPSVPFSLNPEGAYFVGLKIGRRASDLVLIDFLGRVLKRIHAPHPYSTPEGSLALLRRATTDLVEGLDAEQQKRISGLGIASPFELWNWEPQFGAPREVLEAWRVADIRAEAARLSPWPVYYHNDGTAACVAELVLGHADAGANFLYVFIGSFIGGGVVLNGHLFPGRTGYGGALGPMPIPVDGAAGRHDQLLRRAAASLAAEAILAGRPGAPVLAHDPDDWGDPGAPLEGWIDSCAASLAQTAIAAMSIIEFDSIVIDGAIPLAVRRRIVEATRQRVSTYDLQGLPPINLIEGTIGSGAREIGGACLPLLANFTQDREVLFKDNA